MRVRVRVHVRVWVHVHVPVRLRVQMCAWCRDRYVSVAVKSTARTLPK